MPELNVRASGEPVYGGLGDDEDAFVFGSGHAVDMPGKESEDSEEEMGESDHVYISGTGVGLLKEDQHYMSVFNMKEGEIIGETIRANEFDTDEYMYFHTEHAERQAEIKVAQIEKNDGEEIEYFEADAVSDIYELTVDDTGEGEENLATHTYEHYEDGYTDFKGLALNMYPGQLYDPRGLLSKDKKGSIEIGERVSFFYVESGNIEGAYNFEFRLFCDSDGNGGVVVGGATETDDGNIGFRGDHVNGETVITGMGGGAEELDDGPAMRVEIRL